MKKLRCVRLLSATALSAVLLTTGCRESEDVLSYVDPVIGTDGHGHVFLGASVPYGMAMAGPVNGTDEWDWCSGYHYSDDFMIGFSQTHLSGTGMGDLLDLCIMPVTEDYDLGAQCDKTPEACPWLNHFSHADETARPGYYAVDLKDPATRVEIAATERTSLYRISYPDAAERKLILDTQFHIRHDVPVKTRIEQLDDSTFVGYRFSGKWASDQRLFFVMKFSEPVKRHRYYDYGERTETAGDTVEAVSVRAQFDFDAGDEPLHVAFGLSSVSVENAILNLEAENPEFDFDGIVKATEEKWRKKLSVFSVKAETEEEKKVFYTALYHTMVAPTLHSDVNGEYRGADLQVTKKDFNYYTTLSNWDTFRATTPLYTIIEPKLTEDLQKTMLEHYRVTGMLPVWTLWGLENWCMTGVHSVPILVDSYLKGFHAIDGEELLDAVVKSMNQTVNNDRRSLVEYRKYGFVPYDIGHESVTRTLELAFNDYCVAKLAEHLGETELEESYMAYSKAYRMLYDEETGFMRGRSSDNSHFREPFDPFFSTWDRAVADYTEGNAYQHSYFVPHDPQGLIALHGSGEKLAERLDLVFSTEVELEEGRTIPDVSGVIGQYAHGNEPSHHIAYLYNAAGLPWRGQKLVRQIMKELYTAAPDGVCGNEDCGQLSAWYIFSAMGFYPMNPISGEYEFGSPAFDEVSLALPNGKTFTVRAINNSDHNVYVQKVMLNGTDLTRSHIKHREIMEGGVLTFVMGPTPNKALFSVGK
ncbi:hypothetical protein SCARR_01639 [Pontiella sulfatireligans]|uniref:Glycosyl hydrolase family 92 domain-containing protein n=2 Tax=Pontiella sulfatireligans TaxID=2750658 RepID=A0A6C2UHB4_9BACT|nr:hypothetical protein SCARR_01639 [Pontiella sulfatireligans]